VSGRHPKALVQADKRADPVVQDALGKGYLDTDAVYVVPGFATHDAANEGRMSVNRSARRQNLSPGAWVADQDGQPCYKACQDPEAPHSVKFRLWSKDRGRTHVFRESGGDPQNLKWNPWESHRTRRFGDSGEPG
jgi:hypothetical protein